MLLDVDEQFQRLKIRFHEQMVQFHSHSGNNLEIAKSYYQIYDTPLVKADSTQLNRALKLVAFYLILSPKSNEQNDFINRLVSDVALLALPSFHRLVTHFITSEVMNFLDVRKEFEVDIAALPPFAKTEEAERLWKDLHLRIVEHNLQVIAQYYTRITMKRLAELLLLTVDESEKHLSRLVIAGTVYAKIDRPRGIVAFRKPETAEEVLNHWAGDIDALLGLVEHTVHLIERERMVAANPVAAGSD